MAHMQPRRKIAFAVTTSKAMNAPESGARVAYLPGLNKHGKKDSACHRTGDFRRR
jgi:hypothetical protein